MHENEMKMNWTSVDDFDMEHKCTKSILLKTKNNSLPEG